MSELHYEIDIAIRAFIPPSDRAKDSQPSASKLIH